MKPSTRAIVADSVLLFALAAALIAPLFRLKYMDNWSSIESTFIADGRFLKEHWPHPGWQPLWYCGTRFDYIYPPALRYGTALVAKNLPIIPAKAYHIYTALLYCVGIAGVYLLVVGARSRRVAWLAGLAAATLSPSILFIGYLFEEARAIRLMPQRLSVLVRYGEGPHMSSFALIPLALAAAFQGLRRGRPGWLALAAVLSALVVSNNFYGASALAMFFPVLVWAVWITERDNRVWLRAAFIAVLAYGLTACWLSPSYLRVTVENLKLVSEPGNAWSRWLALGVAAAFAAVSARLARGRPERAWGVFVWGSLVFFALNVLGQHYWKFRVAGEPLRLVPELDLVLILAALEALRWMWGWRWPLRPAWARRLPAGCAALLVLLAFSTARHYVRHAWEYFPRDTRFDQRIEYRITNWMAKNLPDARALASGSVRFWYDAWHDLAHVGGGSEQGLLNSRVYMAQWQILLGENPEPAILWLQALGADAVIVHDKESKEQYHDFVHPRKFAGVLAVLYDDHEGNYIYRVPRRFPGLARVVDAARAAALKPVASDADVGNLRAYTELAEHGPDAPASCRREGPDVLRIRATLGTGQAVLVQETFDPYWRAYSGGRRLTVRKDVMDFMLIDAPAGEHDIRLVFETPLENRIGRAATVVSGGAVILLWALALRRREVRS